MGRKLKIEMKTRGLWARLTALFVVLMMTTAQLNAQDDYCPSVMDGDSAPNESKVKLNSKGTKVCKIKETETEYETVYAAVQATTTGQTVQMIADSKESVLFYNKTVTLDLNGHVLEANGYYTVQVNSGSNVTIKDTDKSVVHYFTVGSDGKWTLNTTATSGTPLEDLTERPATNTVIAVKGGVITSRNDDSRGIIVYGTTTLENVNVIGNHRTTGSNAAGSGAGVIAYNGGILHGEGCAICGNVTVVSGGGVYSIGTVDLSNSKISFNKCNNWGGGVDDNGDTKSETNNGTSTLTNCEIIGNEAKYGGGVHNGWKTILKGTTVIAGNKATTLGGGVSGYGYWGLNNAGQVTIDGRNVKITGNTCTDNAALNNYAQETGYYINLTGSGTINTSHVNIGQFKNYGANPPVAVTAAGEGSGTLSDVGYFVSDDNQYIVIYNTNHIELAIPVCKNTTTNVKYTTVQNAINEAGNGHEIQMIANSTEDVSITSEKNVTLNLNGFVLKGTGNSSVVTVASGATFNISDSNPTAVHYFTVGSDGVWTLNTTATSGTPLEDLTERPATNAVIAVKGGVITGGIKSDDYSYGGGVYVTSGENTTHITMSGGNIVGNKVSSAGGGLYLNYKVVFLMTGGNIAGNFAGNMGGGVFLKGDSGILTKSAFTMTGGSIVCNACNGSGGGGVAIDYGMNEFTLTDGLIAFNNAPEGGGVASGGKFTMTGGNITGNEATNAYGYGGGVEEWGSQAGGFIITGGTITGNKAAVAGAGVYVWNSGGWNGDLTFGGTAQITGNTKGSNANNIYLSTGKTIIVSNSTPLTSGAAFGVTTQTAPASGTPVAVTGTNTTDYSMYFISDNINYAVVNESNTVKLKVSVECNTTTAYNPTNIVNGGFDSRPFESYKYNNTVYTSWPGNKFAGNYIQASYPNGVGQGWNSTENRIYEGGLFEWSNSTGTYGLSSSNGYFIEMNAYSNAVFYQDLPTKGGDVIRWSLSHGFRSSYGVQRIRVEVGAPNGDASGVGENVNANITPETCAKYQKDGVTNPTGATYGYAGSLANLEVKTSNWHAANGIYVIPANQSTTRFAFIAETPTNGGGNLLDDITFSTLIGNLQAYTDANGDVIITGYWGDTDASKKLCVKAGETVYQYDMSGVKTTCGGDFKITFSKSQIGTATEVEIYHQDYPSAKVTVKIATHVTLHFCTTETVTGAEDFYGYIPGETTPLPVVSRNGYTFKGWYTNPEYTGEPVTEIGPTETSKTLEFYAKWEADITSDRWAAVVRAYDKGDRPLTGSYTYYPGGTGPATTVPYEGALYTDPDGNKYYCYKTVEMAIEAAQAGALNTNYCSATNPNGVFTEGTPYNYELNDGVNPNIINYTDLVTLNKNYSGFIYNKGNTPSYPERYGIRKGIVLDLNGKTATGIAMGAVADNYVLVVRNGSIGVSLSNDVFDDEGGTGYLTGKVVFRDVNITGTVWSSKHSFYMLNGNYNIQLGNGTMPVEDAKLLQLRGGYYKNDPRAYNIDYSDCHVELASSDPTISPYFCRVVKGASQYTINFHPNGNGNMVGGVAFTGTSVAMTYNGSLDEVPAITREGCVIVGWATSDGAVTPEYTTSQLNTISKQHGAVVDIYPVWGVNIGIPVYVSLDEESDIPEVGRMYGFKILPQNDAPAPATNTVEMASPTQYGKSHRIGYNIDDEDNPWRVTLKDGTYKYYIEQTSTAQEAETIDKGYWRVTVVVHALQEERYVMTNNEYVSEISDLGDDAFASYKYSGEASFSSSQRALIFGSDTQTVGSGYDGFNRAIVKSTFAFDFTKSFVINGTLQVGAAADGSVVGFVPAAGTPSCETSQGSSLGIYGKSTQSKGLFLEFDTYNSGSSYGDGSLSGAHFAVMTTDNYGNASYTGSGQSFGSNYALPTGTMTYTIEFDKNTKNMKFTIVNGTTTYGPWTYNDPVAQFGSNEAYMLLAGAMRYAPANSYGTGSVGSPAPKTKLTFETFTYIESSSVIGGVDNTFVNNLDHVWQYTVADNTIHARCKHDSDTDTHCSDPGVKDLTIKAYDRDYDGQKSVAEITTDEWTASGIEYTAINYTGRDQTEYSSTTAPADFGYYTAKVSPKDDSTPVAKYDFKIRPQIYCTTADAVHGSVTIKDGNGEEIPSGSFVEPYESLTFTATAVKHWHFTQWTNGPTKAQPTDNPLVTPMNANTAHLVGNFEIDKHSITVKRNRPYGTVTIGKDDKTSKSGDEYVVEAVYDYGTAVIMTATPSDPKYTFVWWSPANDTITKLCESPTYQFTLEQDTAFTAVFVNEVQVNIEAAPLDGGQVAIKNNVTGQYLTPEEAKHILYGTSVTIEATCSEDYAFAGWYIKGTNTLFSKKQSMTFDATTLVLNLEARFTDAVIWVRVKK